MHNDVISTTVVLFKTLKGLTNLNEKANTK